MIQRRKLFQLHVNSLSVSPSWLCFMRHIFIYSSMILIQQRYAYISNFLLFGSIFRCSWALKVSIDFAGCFQLKEEISWFSYWIFLGILSSVGLGTGLHTFILYLGPFIAKVTVAAQECATVQFPRPPYPDQLVFPIINCVKLG